MKIRLVNRNRFARLFVFEQCQISMCGNSVKWEGKYRGARTRVCDKHKVLLQQA